MRGLELFRITSRVHLLSCLGSVLLPRLVVGIPSVDKSREGSIVPYQYLLSQPWNLFSHVLTCSALETGYTGRPGLPGALRTMATDEKPTAEQRDDFHDTGAAVLQLAHDADATTYSPWTPRMFRLYLVLACAYLCGVST